MKLPNNKPMGIICPECSKNNELGALEIELVVKTNRLSKSQFLGCPRWPDCNYTRPIPEEIIMRAAGQQELW